MGSITFPCMLSLTFSLLLLMLLLLMPTIQSTKHNANPFKFIQRLKGCHKGQHVSGIRHLKRYLEKFGYLHYDHDHHSGHPRKKKNKKNHKNDNEFDDRLESAVKAYQKFYHLNVSGGLDAHTVHQMVKPRCGMPDNFNGTLHHYHHDHHTYKSVHTTAHFEFFPGRPRWPPSQTHLTYRFRSSVMGVPGTENIKSIIAQAFRRWEQVTHFTFQQVQSNYVSNIVIGFHRRYHGDNSPFDGPRGILAHATVPPHGMFHYDADENWSSNPGPNQVDLESVAVHEIGHLLGLDHSEVQEAIMFAYFGRGITKRKLHRDDIQGIRTLYGLQ